MPEIRIDHMVVFAADHPIKPGHPMPARFDDWSAYVATRHVLLLVVEWSPPHDQMMYHASVSHDRGKLGVELPVAIEVLMCIEELLGAPAFFALAENILHFFWQYEGDSAESVTRETAH